MCQIKIKKISYSSNIKTKKLDELLWDFDTVSFYPSAIWDEKSSYPSIENGYALTKDLNKELVGKFNTDNFNQGCVILKIN